MRIFWGLVGIAIGVLLLKYTYSLAQTFGKFDWAEKYFTGGLGGTYFFYKIAGILVILLSALYMFGILDNLLGPVASLFGGLKKE
jgi:uncharacterized membrane protein